MQPFERGGFHRILVAQPAEQHHGERHVERPGLIGPQQHSLLHRLVLVQQAVGELVRLLAGHPGAHHALGEPAQVFHQHQPQRDRHRPQLADGERLHRLVGDDEPPQALGVEQTVGVGHEVVSEGVDPRIAEEPVLQVRRQLGQLAIEARRQVLADLAHLVLDEMEVVDQPLGGRRDRPFVAHRLGDGAIGREEILAVGPQAVPQPRVTPAAGPHALNLGERQGVLLETFDAPQLVADRLWKIGKGGGTRADFHGLSLSFHGNE